MVDATEFPKYYQSLLFFLIQNNSATALQNEKQC